MGSGDITEPFYIDGKLTFDWADSTSHPALVSKVEWDSAASAYTSCSPSCTFLLQRADALTLEMSTSVALLLQTTHTSSGGNRYFVMEHRADEERCGASMLLIHWTDIMPTTHSSGMYGNTVLTDCNPLTDSLETGWNDAGCALGQSIELDTGTESASVKVWVYVDWALENDQLKVTLATNGPLSLPPAAPSPPWLCVLGPCVIGPLPSPRNCVQSSQYGSSPGCE